MSQENTDKTDAAEARTQQTKGFMQQVRVAARRKYTPEEKVRIMLEGFRREVTVNELCRREVLSISKMGHFINRRLCYVSVWLWLTRSLSCVRLSP